jgi:hypothetical protein
MMPIVNGLAEQFVGQVAVHRLNAGEGTNSNLQTRYGVRGHPSFVVLAGDKSVVERFFGPQTEETLAAAMSAVAPP